MTAAQPDRVADRHEDAFVRVAQRAHRRGYDAGAATIQFHLAARHVEPPSVSTVWRAQSPRVRHPPTPQAAQEQLHPLRCRPAQPVLGRPTSPRDLADGRVMEVLNNIIDHHSRVCVESPPSPSPSAHLTGAAVTGHRLQTLPPLPPPQTCGKIERFHQHSRSSWHAKRSRTTANPDGGCTGGKPQAPTSVGVPRSGLVRVGRADPGKGDCDYWSSFVRSTMNGPSREPALAKPRLNA